jgi:hypothetical protein
MAIPVSDPDLEAETIKGALEYYTAEDGVMITVRKSTIDPGTTGFLGSGGLNPEIGDLTYKINITTRSGNGPYMYKTPGLYVYHPVPLTLPKKFYTPKYTPLDTNRVIPDLRSTIFWEPDIITDKEGKAKISFFSADKPGSYSLILQGTNLNGYVGYQAESLRIDK